MTDDLLSLLRIAWEQLQPTLRRDPDELRRRLARRRNGLMRRPPRAWCLSIRASDTRLNPATAAMAPEDAAYPRASHGYRIYFPHEVVVDAQLMRRLCRPVHLEKAGIEVRLVARKLGCEPGRVRRSWKRGKLVGRRIKGLGGARGPGVPVVCNAGGEPLDSCSGRLLEHADAEWGTHWRWLCDHVPDELEQTIQRVPVYQPERRTRGIAGTRPTS